MGVWPENKGFRVAMLGVAGMCGSAALGVITSYLGNRWFAVAMSVTAIVSWLVLVSGLGAAMVVWLKSRR